MTSACQTVRITYLKTDMSYPIERTENFTLDTAMLYY